MAKTPTFYEIPAGTRGRPCKGATCKATIYLVTNANTGRMIPVHADVEGGKRPSAAKDAGQSDAFTADGQAVYPGRGILHFFDCPDADNFGRGSR
jgi:hypothetical protein